MRRTLALLLVVSFACAVAAESDPGTQNLSGRVVHVGAKILTVEVQEEQAREVELAIGPETRIVKEGKAVELSALNAEDAVLAAYRSMSGSNVALTITVQAKLPEEPAE